MGLTQTPQALVPAAFTSGSMTLLSTTTLSGISTTVSSINQSYKNLYIQVFGVTNGTGTASFRFSLNTNNLNTNKVAPGNITLTREQTIVNVEDGSQQQNNTGGNNYMNFMFYNYASTTNYKTYEIYGTYNSATSNGRVITIFGGVSSNTAISSFTFTNDADYTFNAGTILCYGVN